MPEGTFDLAIIGGGINGCGVARDAAGRGLSVFLCDKGDLAGATSSASTKLIHGGLRYLEHYDFGLVRKALAAVKVVLLDRSGRILLIRSEFDGRVLWFTPGGALGERSHERTGSANWRTGIG